MTTNQLLSHAEQVDAARVDFLKLWERQSKFLAQRGFNEPQLCWAQLVAWDCFLHAANLSLEERPS